MLCKKHSKNLDAGFLWEYPLLHRYFKSACTACNNSLIQYKSFGIIVNYFILFKVNGKFFSPSRTWLSFFLNITLKYHHIFIQSINGICIVLMGTTWKDHYTHQISAEIHSTQPSFSMGHLTQAILKFLGWSFFSSMNSKNSFFWLVSFGPLIEEKTGWFSSSSQTSVKVTWKSVWGETCHLVPQILGHDFILHKITICKNFSDNSCPTWGPTSGRGSPFR